MKQPAGCASCARQRRAEGRINPGGQLRRLSLRELFRDHAAGYAVSGIARGIGLVVVGFGVDNDRGAVR